jgi:outer membrane protein assembly factor BamB
MEGWIRGVLQRAAWAVAPLAIVMGAAGVAAAPRAAAGSAAWPSFHFDAARTGFDPAETAVGAGNVAHLSSKWVGMSMGGLVVDSSPAVTATTVYITDDYLGRLWAFSTSCASGGASCRPSWSGQMSSDFSSESSPAVANGLVYVGSNDGRLYVFDANGCGAALCQPLWTGMMSAGAGASSPLVEGGVVYLGTSNDRLFAFSASGCGSSTCSPLWAGAGSGGNGFTAPAYANGVVYVTSLDSGGKLFAFPAAGCGSATCRPLWSADTGTSSNLIESGAALADGVAYVGVDGGVAAFAAAGCGASMCGPLWTGSHGSNEFAFGTPAVAGGFVYAGVGSVLEVFSAGGCGHARCDALWTGSATGTQAEIDSSPAVANGVVYVGENSMKVLAFDAGGCGSTTCYPLWQGATDDSVVSSSPAIVNGVLYIGSGNRFYPDDQAGRLYAFALDASIAEAPTISGFTPTSGPAGTTVTVTGSNFTGAIDVNFNTVAATFTVGSDSQITATVPAGATSGAIAVSNASGTAVSAAVFTVTNPDFTITATPTSQTVTAGAATHYMISITPIDGFSGNVALGLTGLPAGATATFTPSSTSGSSTLAIQTSRSAKTGASTLTVTGTSGSLTHATTVTLQITKK